MTPTGFTALLFVGLGGCFIAVSTVTLDPLQGRPKRVALQFVFAVGVINLALGLLVGLGGGSP